MNDIRNTIHNVKFCIRIHNISYQLDAILSIKLWNDILISTRHTVHINIFRNI